MRLLVNEYDYCLDIKWDNIKFKINYQIKFSSDLVNADQGKYRWNVDDKFHEMAKSCYGTLLSDFSQKYGEYIKINKKRFNKLFDELGHDIIPIRERTMSRKRRYK